MALEEEGMIDDRNGRVMNSNLAEYHIAVHADIQKLDVIFVEEKDEIVNPLGAKGLGEIGIVGVASAIANAVFDATGIRKGIVYEGTFGEKFSEKESMSTNSNFIELMFTSLKND
ncbi:unnamed protein product [Bathycoccus prasinos]